MTAGTTLEKSDGLGGPTEREARCVPDVNRGIQGSCESGAWANPAHTGYHGLAMWCSLHTAAWQIITREAKKENFSVGGGPRKEHPRQHRGPGDSGLPPALSHNLKGDLTVWNSKSLKDKLLRKKYMGVKAVHENQSTHPQVCSPLKR